MEVGDILIVGRKFGVIIGGDAASGEHMYAYFSNGGGGDAGEGGARIPIVLDHFREMNEYESIHYISPDGPFIICDFLDNWNEKWITKLPIQIPGVPRKRKIFGVNHELDMWFINRCAKAIAGFMLTFPAMLLAAGILYGCYGMYGM